MKENEWVWLLPLLMGEASGVFAAFNPSWFTVASPFFHEQDAKAGNVKRIRWGEIAATGIVVGTGLAISKRFNDKTAFWLSVGVSALFVGGYEYMIAHPSKDDSSPEQRRTNFRVVK